jgi:hypothetical protein
MNIEDELVRQRILNEMTPPYISECEVPSGWTISTDFLNEIKKKIEERNPEDYWNLDWEEIEVVILALKDVMISHKITRHVRGSVFGKHPYRCETCGNKKCDYYEVRDNMSAGHDIQTGWRASPAVITFAVGCASHIMSSQYKCDSDYNDDD